MKKLIAGTIALGMVSFASAASANVEIDGFVCQTGEMNGAVHFNAKDNNSSIFKRKHLNVEVYDTDYKDPNSARKVILSEKYELGGSYSLYRIGIWEYVNGVKKGRKLNAKAEVYISSSDQTLRRTYQCDVNSYFDYNLGQKVFY